MNTEREILEYLSESGSCPFQNWLENLKDIKGRAIIRKKINLLRLAYFSDSRSLGDNLFEIRIFFSPGYRVYFGKQGKKQLFFFGEALKIHKKEI